MNKTLKFNELCSCCSDNQKLVIQDVVAQIEHPWAENFSAFRKELRQLLNDCGVKSNPGWSEEDIVQAFKGLLKKHYL